jgi:hypothetical protein
MQWGALAGLVVLVGSAAAAQQVADTGFAPAVERPAYAADRGPKVAIDEAHLNFHTADGGYAPFAKLLRLDGYQVQANRDPFTAGSLGRADILVVANAMHKQSEADWAPLPTLSAFTAQEVAAAEAWVRAGGSLLLIADHMPLAGHAEALAAAFGVRFQNGFAQDSALAERSASVSRGLQTAQGRLKSALTYKINCGSWRAAVSSWARPSAGDAR